MHCSRTEAAKSDNPAYVYCASKKIAEEACWEFQKKEKPSFDITAINPPMIFGPPEQELKSLDSLNTSAGAVWGVVDAKEVPPVGFPGESPIIRLYLALLIRLTVSLLSVG